MHGYTVLVSYEQIISSVQIKSNDDCNTLQKTLNLISCWANEWQLKLSENVKCCTLIHDLSVITTRLIRLKYHISQSVKILV